MSAADLADYAARIELPDETARAAAREQLASMQPLGRLGDLAVWLAGVQGQWPIKPIARPRLVLFAADHGVAAAGVSAQPPGATAATVRDVAAGRGPVAALARETDVSLRVVDVAVATDLGDVLPDGDVIKIRRSSGRIDREDAISVEQAARAIETGAGIADAEIDAGTDVLLIGTIGVGATTAAATVIAALTTANAADVTGRGSGIDDRAWMRKCAAIRDALRRARPVIADRLLLLAVAGGADVAAVTGFLLQAAGRQTPVILDGLPVMASALVAHRIAYRAADWWLPGHPVAEPAYDRALKRLVATPAVDHGARLAHGGGALLALPLLRTAAVLASEGG